MKPVLIKDLESYEYLPFDLYAKNGCLIFSSGEPLTAGKLLKLSYVEIFRRDDPIRDHKNVSSAVSTEEKVYFESESANKSVTPVLKPEYTVVSDQHRIEEINPESLMPSESQVYIKSKMHQVFDTLTKGDSPDPYLYNAARDKIVSEVIGAVEQVSHLNQLRVFDDYDYSHGVNVAILSVMLGHSLKIKISLLHEMALGALLHDIGKTRIPKQVLYKPGRLSEKEYELVKLHAPLGYKIVKDELGLDENVARIALEHQEKFDGTGYPKGLSGDNIHVFSQIVGVCDVYDALVSTKVYSNSKPSQDAIKIMLNYGSKWFNPRILYKFTHMCSFNE